MRAASFRDLLAHHFNNSELRHLCFDLEIEFEELSGEARTDKAQALVAYSLRHDRLADLLARCQELRPAATWPDLSSQHQEGLKLGRLIAAQNDARGIFPDEQIDEMLTLLSDRLEALLSEIAKVGVAGDNVGGDKVAGDKVMGDKIMGDKNVTPADPSQIDPAALRHAYLDKLLASSNQLSLAGIDPKAASAEQSQLQLSAVYTALLTRTREEYDRDQPEATAREQPRQLSALEMLNGQQRLVLLGDPGSGKSTFVNFVAACLAGACQQHPQLNLELLTQPLPPEEEHLVSESQAWDHGPLLPVVIVLRDLAARGLPAAKAKATADHLWAFLTAELAKQELGEYAPFLKKELLEQGGLILFDGLDEVPQASNHRLHIKQLVEDVATTFSRCRVLVTSRTYAYQNQVWRLQAGFQASELAPFSLGHIRAFVSRWYQHIAIVRHIDREDAQGRATLLQQAIMSSKRLLELAERPLLLTLMASLHAWRGGSLPEKREELYADAVELLLDSWEQQRVGRDDKGQITVIHPSLQQWLQADRDLVRTALDRLAFAAHASQPDLEGTADVPEADLVIALMRLNKNPEVSAERLIEYLRDRAGLLLPRGEGVYTFPHRTFQEYLAASHLTNSDYPEQVARLARHDPNRWREVALLAGAKAFRGSSYALWGLVQELCFGEPGRLADLADHWGARLAGQLLVENGALEALSDSQTRQLALLARWLAAAATGELLPALERAAAGRYLAVVGDPRPGVGLLERDGVALPEILWGELVPAGTYTIGGDSQALGSFERQQVIINLPFRLSRYPITQAQFRCFATAPDYLEPRWWQDMPARVTDYDDRGYAVQELKEPRYPFANYPRDSVSWYQAVAFSRWLHEKLLRDLPEGSRLALPHEYEWEVAARYPDGRSFPWGDEFAAEMANTAEGGVGRNSTVGIYPAGRQPQLNLYDLSGNVWEWCQNEYRKPEQVELDINVNHRALRGGSWFGFASGARAARRNSPQPDGRNNYIGFRLVVRLPPSQADH